MLQTKVFLTLCIIVILATVNQRITSVLAASCSGCVDLDDINFDKTIARFPYALVKFDIAFPYGEKHEAFAEFSRAAHKITDELLVATVGIKDYGDNENKQLGLRYKSHDGNFPGIFFFKGNPLKGYVKFPDHLDVTVDNLKKFVTENSHLYIGRDGCIKELNDLVDRYANQDDAKQLELLQKAEELAKEYAENTERVQNAKIYLIFMRKINEKGYDFVEEETKRLLRLKAGKVNAAKKTEIQQKLNILESFRVTKLTKSPKEDL